MDRKQKEKKFVNPSLHAKRMRNAIGSQELSQGDNFVERLDSMGNSIIHDQIVRQIATTDDRSKPSPLNSEIDNGRTEMDITTQCPVSTNSGSKQPNNRNTVGSRGATGSGDGLQSLS